MSTFHIKDGLRSPITDTSEKLDPLVIKQRIAQLPLWTIGDEGFLVRKFQAKNFETAMEFIRLVGMVKVFENPTHHPDIHLTESRNIKIEVHTNNVNGVTEADFRVASKIDLLPVVYSTQWRHDHPEAFANEKPVLKSHNLLPTNMQKIHHKQSDTFLPKAAQMRDVHSSSVSDDGSILHEDEFKIHTGHNIPPGHSDAPHHEIYPTNPHVGSYETESQHANRQGHPEDNSFKQYGKENQFKPAFNTTQSEDAKRRTKELWKVPFKPHEAWIHMAHALKILINHGYDSTEAEYLLPVIESESSYPGAEEAMERFYNHLVHRLTPAWKISEPDDVVSACQEFVDGYERVHSIVHKMK